MINGGVDGGSGSVNYYLDGGTNMTGLRNTGNIAPNPDAVDEFRVVTKATAPNTDISAGGVINIITRSGGNVFHGSLFEFFRNNDLNAYPCSRSPLRPLHRNSSAAPSAAPSARTRRSSSGRIPGCGRSPARSSIRRWCPRPWSAPALSQSKILPKDRTTGT